MIVQPSNVGIIPIRSFIIATHAPSASIAAVAGQGVAPGAQRAGRPGPRRRTG